jgi:hypothetical protein
MWNEIATWQETLKELCRLLESSVKQMEGLISTMTSYFDVSQMNESA